MQTLDHKLIWVKVNVYLALVCLTESYMHVNGVNISYLLISVSPLWGFNVLMKQYKGCDQQVP